MITAQLRLFVPSAPLQADRESRASLLRDARLPAASKGKKDSRRRHYLLTYSLNGPLVLREYLDLRHATESPARDAIILPARLVMRVEADKNTNRVDAFCDRLTKENRETCRLASIIDGSQRVLSGPDALMPQP